MMVATLMVIVIFAALIAGVATAQVLDQALCKMVAGQGARYELMGSLGSVALQLKRQRVATERPDSLNWTLAPALLLALAAAGMAVNPWSHDFVPVDLETTLVLWGAVEVLATVVIFLFGWSANAHFPLIGAYRYVSLGLSYMLVSMFVLIGVALPAESLRVSEVVESQSALWNVVRQPLGLPLFLIVGLGLTFWGPLNFASPRDLAGGVSADVSGRHIMAWEFARRALLIAFCFMAASAFLGGWHGPLLPGPVWLIIKALVILLLVLLAGHLLPRPHPDQFLTFAWVVLLPLSFLDLVWAGVLAL